MGVLILRDELLASAGVTGQGVGAQGMVRGNQTQLDQGIHGGNEARGVAARVGHPLGTGDPRPMVGGELRKPVVPTRGGAVGGGGVDHPGVGIVNHGHRLPGRLVGQAQEDQVGGVEAFLPFRRVLALFLVNEKKLDILAGGQPVVDLQAGGALPSVDENHRFHASRSWINCLRCSIWTFTASGAGPP